MALSFSLALARGAESLTYLVIDCSLID